MGQDYPSHRQSHRSQEYNQQYSRTPRNYAGRHPRDSWGPQQGESFYQQRELSSSQQEGVIEEVIFYEIERGHDHNNHHNNNHLRHSSERDAHRGPASRRGDYYSVTYTREESHQRLVRPNDLRNSGHSQNSSHHHRGYRNNDNNHSSRSSNSSWRSDQQYIDNFHHSSRNSNDYRTDPPLRGSDHNMSRNDSFSEHRSSESHNTDQDLTAHPNHQRQEPHLRGSEHYPASESTPLRDSYRSDSFSSRSSGHRYNEQNYQTSHNYDTRDSRANTQNIHFDSRYNHDRDYREPSSSARGQRLNDSFSRAEYQSASRPDSHSSRSDLRASDSRNTSYDTFHTSSRSSEHYPNYQRQEPRLRGSEHYPASESTPLRDSYRSDSFSSRSSGHRYNEQNYQTSHNYDTRDSRANTQEKSLDTHSSLHQSTSPQKFNPLTDTSPQASPPSNMLVKTTSTEGTPTPSWRSVQRSQNNDEPSSLSTSSQQVMPAAIAIPQKELKGKDVFGRYENLERTLRLLEIENMKLQQEFAKTGQMLLETECEVAFACRQYHPEEMILE